MKEQGAERLLYLMTQIPDELLDEGLTYQKPVTRTVFWSKGVLVAACLCVCLIGGLAWNTLREPLGENQTTLAGWTAGAAGGQGGKPTLAQPVDPTGASPVDSTDETPLDPTDAAPENFAGGVGMMVSEFWYQGQLYVDTGVLLETLPDSCEFQGVLSESGLDTEENGIAKDPALAGSKVNRMEGDYTGLYVETEGGYRYYGKGDVGE